VTQSYLADGSLEIAPANGLKHIAKNGAIANWWKLASNCSEYGQSALDCREPSTSSTSPPEDHHFFLECVHYVFGI